MVATGAPDNSNWPPGSSEIAPPPVTSDRPMMLRPFHDRLPAEQRCMPSKQRPNSARSLIGDRPMAGDREGEFFMLGADAKLFARLFARGEPRDQFVARLDRRHIDLVTSHAVLSAPERGATLHPVNKSAIAVKVAHREVEPLDAA